MEREDAIRRLRPGEGAAMILSVATTWRGGPGVLRGDRVARERWPPSAMVPRGEGLAAEGHGVAIGEGDGEVEDR